MSYSCSARKPDGTFSYECHDWQGNLFRAEEGFATSHARDRAAEAAEREMTMLALGRGAEPDVDWAEVEAFLKELDGES